MYFGDGLLKYIKKNINLIIIAIITLLAVILVSYVGIKGQYDDTDFRTSYFIEEIDNVTYVGDGKDVEYDIEFPYKLQRDKGNHFYLTAKLPDKIPEHYGIMIDTNYSKIVVYVAGYKISSYAEATPLKFGKLVGNVKLVSLLDPKMAGKDISIAITPYYSGLKTINSIKYGDISSLKLEVIYNNLWRIAVVGFILAIATICILLFIFHSLKIKNILDKEFIHLGLFLTYVAMWLVCSSDIPQLYTSSNEAVALASFLSLAMMGIHFAGYSKGILVVWTKHFDMLMKFGMIIPVMEIFGFVTGLFDPPIMLVPNHLYLATVLISTLICSIKNHRHFKVLKHFSMAMVMFIFFVMLGLIAFYMNPVGGYDAVFISIGLAVFAVMLLGVIIYREVSLLEERKKLDVYNEVAYTDQLTLLGNRAGFDAKFDEIVAKAVEDTLISLVILDIKGMKDINNMLGHSAGDSMIRSAAEMIKGAFSSQGDCFRINGDEFAVLMVDKHLGIKRGLTNIEESIEAYNRTHTGVKMSMAIGAAEKTWENDFSFSRKLFEEADSNKTVDKNKEE